MAVFRVEETCDFTVMSNHYFRNTALSLKAKVALNLTKRQLICFSLAAAVGVPTYLLTHTSIGNDIAVILMIGLMLGKLAAALLTAIKRDWQAEGVTAVSKTSVGDEKGGIQQALSDLLYTGKDSGAALDALIARLKECDYSSPENIREYVLEAIQSYGAGNAGAFLPVTT